MKLRLIYPDPPLEQQVRFMNKMNELTDWEVHFEGKGNGEVIAVAYNLNNTGGKNGQTRDTTK